MPEYRVVWEIDIEADSPRKAAEQARSIMLDPFSSALFFDVKKPNGSTVEVDLETPEI